MSSSEGDSASPFMHFIAMSALSALLVVTLAFIAYFISQRRWLLAVACLPGAVYDLALIFTSRKQYQSRSNIS